ncbi:MAG: 6-phospho-beta-glucosidase, partial [Cetobacterium sp.]
EIYKDENLSEKPKELENRGGAYYSEAACELISSIYNNKKSLMVVNVHNNGIIKSISDDSVIETTAYITSSGAIPLGSTQLPLSASAEVALLKTFEKLVIDAAMNCDYGKALAALTINPLVSSATLAKEALDLVIEQNKKYLKGW